MNKIPTQASMIDKRTRWAIGILVVAFAICCAALFTILPLPNFFSSKYIANAADNDYRQYLHSIVLPDGARCVLWAPPLNVQDNAPAFVALSCQ